MRRILNFLVIFLFLICGWHIAAGDFAENNAQLQKLIQEQPKLTNLTLGGEKITDKEMSLLVGFPKLTKLRLTGTKVTDKGLQILEKLPLIEDLGLNTFDITDQGLIYLKNLNNLTHLDLGSTQVSDAGLKSLSDMQKLKYLDLGYTKVCGTGLNNCPNLENLRLVGKQITDEGLVELGKLKNLGRLDLGGDNITGKGLANLRNLKSLEELYLSGKKITAVDILKLNNIPSLTKLSLYRINLTDTDLKAWKKSEVKELWLDDAEVTESAVRELKKVNSNLKILYHKPKIVDAFTRDGKLVDVNGSFSLHLSKSPESSQGKRAAVVGGTSIKLKQPVTLIINGKKRITYKGGSIMAPLTYAVKTKKIFAGKNSILVENIPETPLYLNIKEFGPGKKFRRYLLKQTLSSQDGKDKKEFTFIIK